MCCLAHLLDSKVRRGRQLTCTGCKGKGATIGCLVETCKNSFHFPCAEETEWLFSTADVGFHCPRCRKRLGISSSGGEGGGVGGSRGSGSGRGAAQYGLEENEVWISQTPADRRWLTMDNPLDAMTRGFCPQVKISNHCAQVPTQNGMPRIREASCCAYSSAC